MGKKYSQIEVGSYRANGPFSKAESLLDTPGVYIVLSTTSDTENFDILDVGESKEVRTRLLGHERKNCWKRECRGRLHFAVIRNKVSTQSERLRIEKEIRDDFDPPCGER